MQHDNTRNTIIFIVCMVAILGLYQIFVMGPAAERRAAEAPAEAGQVQPGLPTGPAEPVRLERREAAAASPRVPIETPALRGSLALSGGRIDDLFLTNYRETVDEDSPPVELFRPRGAEYAYFAQLGWVGANVPGLPGPDTVWTLTSGTSLAPGRPIVLTHDNGQGLTFTRRVEVDEQYMFTITDTVANRSGAALTVAPYGSVQRQGVPDTLGKNMILHEGAIGYLDEGLKQVKYKEWAKKELIEHASTGGWLGITDKYWLAALIPAQRDEVKAQFRVTQVNGIDVHEASYVGEPVTIAPGRQITETTHLFAGAKRAEVLSAYGEELGVSNLDNAIDWGMFWFLTRPIFFVVEWFYGLVGNFGVAILLLTVSIKLLLFPLANKAYESMSKMKKLQPKMEEIKTKFAGDAPKQQQEMMALYQREKVNPMAGCLPILVQIPVFYALYKVLFVTIEMRHAPFFGWIRDLSSRDPTTVWNLFGAIPWDPATAPLVGGLLDGALHLGVLPIFYGLTMWLQMAMNPPPPDPVQRQIFAFFPFIFTFIMAPFAAGLLIYWAWNNLLSIVQQWFIMRRFGAENPIDTLLARFGGSKAT